MENSQVHYTMIEPEELPRCCPKCGKRFKRKVDLRQHVRDKHDSQNSN